MTHTEIVMKLIGSIQPAGDSGLDRERMENLKALCALVDNLVVEIDRVVTDNEHAHQASIKEMANYSKNFLANTLGIKD